MEDLYLLPEDLHIEPAHQTRLWKPADQGIEELALSIMAIGQTDSGVVVRGEYAHRYYLTIGHRRRRAIALINEWNEGKNLPMQKMRVRLDLLGDPLQKAIQSNWHMANYSPMDKAAMVARLRKIKGWYYTAGAQKIADYLNASITYILQHEKLLKLEPEAQDALHSGAITMGSALELTHATELHAKAVLALAAKIEEETRSLNGKSIAMVGRIRRPAILGAIDALRTKEGMGKGLGRKKRGEILKMLIDLDEAGEIQYQKHYANGDRSIFIRIFCKWAQGAGSERDVIDAWNKMTKNTDPGSPMATRMKGRPLGSKNAPKFSPTDKNPKIERNTIDI